jgi:DNA polymerase III subunit alpha
VENSFITVHDFLRKTNPILLNKNTLSHLARSGVFDELVVAPQSKLNREEKLSILDAEKAELSVYITDHPLSEVSDFIADKAQDTIMSLLDNPNKNRAVVGGIISKLERKVSKASKVFYVLEFEDLTGSIEVLIFPREASKVNVNDIQPGNIGVLDATVHYEGEEDNLRVKLFYQNFTKVNPMYLQGDPPILLHSKTKLSGEQMTKLCDIIDKHRGTSYVYLKYPEGDHMVTLKFKTCASKSVESVLKSIVQINSLENQEFEF